MRSMSLPFYARLSLTLLMLVLICFILQVASSIFIPLVFALLIAIFLSPINLFFINRLHLPRSAAAMLSVILFVSGVALFSYFLALQLSGFSKDFPLLKTRFLQMVSSMQHWISATLHISTTEQMSYFNRSVNGLLATMGNRISNAFLAVMGGLLLGVFVLIFTFFILYHRRLLMNFVLHLFNVTHREKVKEVIVETKVLINAYVSGLVIEMLILSVVNCGMFLIMGIKYALLLGVVAAVLNIIPYLGIYTSIAISMLVTFANSSPVMALEVGIGLFAVHMLDSNFLFPRIVGGRVKMNPFITIVAVIVGEFVWGIPGMFLFIPITGIIKLVSERVDGMEAWSILIGEDETPRRSPKKISLDNDSVKEN